MKKIIVVSLIVITAIAAGILLYNKYTSVAIEDVLPQDPVFLLHAANVADNFTAFTSSEVWKSISGINYELLLRKNNVPEEKIKEMQQVIEAVSSATVGILFKKIFGKELALAIFIDENNKLGSGVASQSLSNYVEDLFSGIFVVTRIPADVQALEFMSQSINQISPEVEKTAEEYKKHIIQIFTFKGSPVRFSYVRIRDVLVMGVPSAVRHSVDVFVKETPSLAQDDSYQKIQDGFLSHPDLTGYWDMNRTFDFLKDQAIAWVKSQSSTATPENLSTALKSVDDFFAQLEGFTLFIFSVERAPMLKAKFDLLFDPDQLNPETAKLYASCHVVPNPTLDFIPKDILGYQWSSCLNLGHYWRQIKNEMAKAKSRSNEEGGESVEFKIKGLEEQWGLTIENDILPAFGDEVGGYLSDIQTGALFPIPHLLFFVEVADQNKVEQILAKLKTSPYLQFETEDFSGTTIYYAASPVGPLIEPTYCFFNNYLFVTINRAIMKNSLAAVKDKNLSLQSHEDFVKNDFGLAGEHTGVQFIKLGAVFEKIEGLVEFGNSLLAIQEAKQEAFQAGSERRLLDKRNELANKEQELTSQKAQLTGLEDEIRNLTQGGVDATLKNEELTQLKEKITISENEITTFQKQIAELEALVAGFEERKVGPELRRLYIDEAIKPFLKGLQSLDTFGSQTDFKKGLIQTKMFLK